MPRPFTDTEKQKISEKLLSSAERLMTKSGVRKTTVDELAAAAGVSKGGFYLFYETKEELFADVLERFEARFRDRLLVWADEGGDEPRENIAYVLRHAVDEWRRHPVLQAFGHDEMDYLLSRLPAERARQMKANEELFAQEILARWWVAGIPVPATPGQLAKLFRSLVSVALQKDELGTSAGWVRSVLIESAAAFLAGEIDAQGVP